ncbi:hypothetical protein [Arthrobacter mobilis]|uniref:Uncharacterized protein n=1 Tax=Arthrobacter mobilis TaxID=2724944 RepID=A0A7X6HHE5_9MICC|nr:hypothetical protein [Arthrobacter mobilis]NKX56264.1 hypothetical protein [Arthrobacter mobilis]
MAAGTALDWLAAIEPRSALSDDAKTIAAHLTYGWQGIGQDMRLGQPGLQQFTGWRTRGRIMAVAHELRRAGFLTGYGTRERRFRPTDPAERLPKAREQAAVNDPGRKLKALRGGAR